MRDRDITAITAWLVERGLAGASETELMHGFCARCGEAGLALSRGLMLADTLHPVHEGRPVTTVYLGLHIGTVLYGDIGSESRLDFTVVGPAVNEVSRIATMCRSADRGVLLSSDFRAAAPPEARSHLVSVGRYALRGVGKAQELFTLDETA